MSAALPLLANSIAYNRYINLSPPRHPDFDVRSFADNMESVKLQVPAFRLGFYQLALLKSGSGSVSQDGKKQEFNNYTLFFNLPGQIIYWDIPSDWRGYYFSLAESYYTVQLDGYSRLATLPFFNRYTPAIALRETEAQQIIGLFQQLETVRDLPTTHFNAISKGLVNGILAYALQFYDRYTAETVQNIDQVGPAARFVDLVQREVTALGLGISREPLTVGGLADSLFVSPQHLSAVVKSATGLTPTAYLQNALLEEAQKLLRATELPISEIADQLAFNDPSYFSRLFKKVVGKSPGSYRKTQLKLIS